MFRLICMGTILLILAGCSMDGTPTRNNDFTPLTSIEIVAENASIAARTSTRLTVKGNFSGQFTRDITAQAVWSSNAPTVAGFSTAENPNRVSGHVPGTAILTATVGTVATTFTLTVTPATVTTLTIIPAAPALAMGQRNQLAASGTFSDGTIQDLTFDAAWFSNAPAVASVSDAAGNKGIAAAHAAGSTTISATFDGVSGSTLLTVTRALLQSITVVPANPSLVSQACRSFQATGLYSDGSTADITGQVAWHSSRPDIATTAAGGTVKTLVPGATLISASLDGVSGTSNLKVTGGNLTGIVLSPANFRLVKDTAAAITATGTFSNGSSRDITGVVDWSVANATIASVTMPTANQALLNALAVTASSIRITAKAGLVTSDANLTVTAPQLQSIALFPATLDLAEGTSGRFTLTATFNDGSTQDVTLSSDWTSSADMTAPVDNSGFARGRVRGVAAADGSVTISAAYGFLTVTAPVTVRKRTIASLAIAGNSAVVVGNQVKFTATATYTDASVRNVTADVTWSTDKPNVAIMVDNQNQPGQLVAVDSGTAVLTADYGDKSQVFNITIQ